MKRWIFILPIVLCFGFISIYAQNEDTPNLSFDKGNFSGWSLNTGDYYKDLITTEYVYDWTPVNSTGQISLMNSIGTLDPIVCGKFNLQTVPDGASVSARIGVPLKCENFRSAGCSTRVANRKAMAERMTYSFIVTENTTLFTYRFATVLHIPNGGVGSGQHNGGQYPIFSIDVTVEDPLTGEKSVMPCGSYEAKADDENMSLTRNEDCYASSSPYPTEYMFRNWSTSGYDLRNHIGKKVTIDIRTHDCLVDISSSCSSYGEKAKDVPGNHEAYGYFYAQTRKLELITVNCGTTNPTIEAPQGFTTYEWSRSDGKLISPSDPTKPWFVEIPRNSMTEGVVYYCKLVSDMTNCADLTLSTELKPVVITPKFTTNFGCSGNVEFTNTTLVDGDDIRTCEWDFGDGTTSTDVSPTHQYAEGDSSYLVKLRVITNLGCEKTITQTIRVPFYPNLLVSGAKSVCYGDEIQLTVDGAEIGSTYSWTRKTVTGVTSGVLSDKAVLNVIADTSADYTVTVKDSRYCTYTQITHVSVMQHPIITISGKSPVCKEEKVELKATEGLSDYSWNIGANTSSVVVYPSQNTDYKVTAKGSNGCYGSASFPIETLDLPDVSISGKSEICEGEQVTLTATGANNYKWISDSQYIIGDSRIVKPVNDSTFTVIGYDNNGCSSIVSKQILVKKVPEVFITGEPEVCQGYTTTMTAKGASTFVWNDGSTTSTVNKVIRGDSVFTVVGSLNGCSALATYNVTMKPSPTVYVDGKTEICYGETLDLTAKGADVYSWNTGQQTANMNEKPDNSSSYWVSGAYDNGCVNKVEVKVTVNKLPDIKIDGETSVCYGSEDKLTASGEASNYFWQGINQGSTFSPIITKDTTFTVVGEDANGCKNSKSINVKTKPIPEITVTASKKDICVGASSLLTATGAANYEWNDGPMSSTYNVTPNQSTTYTVRGELNGCKSEQTVLIEVHNPPSLWIEGETNVCFGSALSLKAHGAETYKWNTLLSKEISSDMI
ncbi:MAG TPA: PKD domain-containing protein [Paludibacteraceae bacterium]|nr:PKD domain-containing protein [Paludibacteraceae bacterium]HQF50919.1 PKD domain-containing protein [Paludibacteraceae bacterium]